LLQLDFVFPLRDVGLVHVERGLRLIDLLADFAIFDLGDQLALGDPIAKFHRNALDAARDAGNDVDRSPRPRGCRRR
jgi:hypothetical protein